MSNGTCDGPGGFWVNHSSHDQEWVPCPRCNDTKSHQKTLGWKEFIDTAPKLAQRQDSVTEQLRDLRLVANKLGFYDAADFLKDFVK